MVWQKQMKVDEVTQPGWEDAADDFGERDKIYGTSGLMVLAVIQPYTVDDAATPTPPIVGDHMECLAIVPGISQLPQGPS